VNKRHQRQMQEKPQTQPGDISGTHRRIGLSREIQIKKAADVESSTTTGRAAQRKTTS